MKLNSGCLTVLLLMLLFTSCIKEKIIDDSSCKKNCQRLRLSGQLLDVSTNTGITNTEIKAHFYQYKSSCFICFGTPMESFAKTITDNSGRFSFEILVDTLAFNGRDHYILLINTAENAQYILGEEKRFYSLNNDFSNIMLTKYKKATLAVNFKRDSSDIFNEYVVRHTFRDITNGQEIDPNRNGFVLIKPYTSSITDTTVNIVTAGNFWTKVIGRKYSTTSTLSIHTDSVFCSINGPNSITIKY